MLFLRLSYGHRSNQYHFKEDLFHANRKQKRISSKGFDRHSSFIFVRTCYLYHLCVPIFSPYTMLVVSPLWSLLAAITYFLVAAKTKKPWALFIFCAVTGIYGFYPPMIICCIIAGIISALIAWKTGCTNGKTLTFSYIIYMVLAAFSGTYIPFLFFSNQTLEQYAGMFGESYLGILQTLVSPVTAIIMLVVVAICAFVGALIAKKLLKKHFKKAGMV